MFLFGKSKSKTKSKQVDTVDTVQHIKSVIKTQEKRETHLTSQIISNKENAKESMINKNKQKALYHLRKAKMFEKQLDNIYGTKANLELQLFSLEQAISNKYVIDSIQKGKQAIKLTEQGMNPDDVAELMEDLSERIRDVNEIGDIMSRPIGDEVDDDDELLDELCDMVKETEVKETEVKETEVKETEVKETEVDETEKTLSHEEKELKELEMLMQM
jgi:charged multivesicular body protein 4